MSSRDFCSDISVIPQFESTCWFNAILMSCFFSQRMRKLLINKVFKTWDNTSLFKFFKILLKNSYNTADKARIEELLTSTSSDIILLKVLNKNDKQFYDYLKKIYNTGWHTDYIYNFYKFINVNLLDISVLSDSTILLNFMKYKKPCIIDNDIELVLSMDFNINQEKEKREIEEIIRNNPDVLILNHDSLRTNELYDAYNTILETNDDYDIHEARNYDLDDIAIDDIVKYKDEIHLFGNVYKLDSVLLDNYNEIEKHAILGLHCNNNRYIYNGWLSKKRHYNTPCPLFKFNWDLKTDKEFCLKTKECKMVDIKSNKLCFSFNKGDRLLIYVKDNSRRTSVIPDFSYSSLSKRNEIIRDYYQLDNLTIVDIKKMLDYFEIDYKNVTDLDDFEDLLMNKLQELYNYDGYSKKQLIEKIMKLNPDIKGLTEKTKSELHQLINKLQMEKLKLGAKRKKS